MTVEFLVAISIVRNEFDQRLMDVHAQTTILHVEFQRKLSWVLSRIVKYICIIPRSKSFRSRFQVDLVKPFEVTLLSKATIRSFDTVDDDICVPVSFDCIWIKSCNQICIACHFIDNLAALLRYRAIILTYD
jgi:hypothetical protein